ncbi:MAG: T9SS type A sorting domain-containing protein [bacterium]|nr:T9SS type A sorting domain-containing protein [bacterium]
MLNFRSLTVPVIGGHTSRLIPILTAIGIILLASMTTAQIMWRVNYADSIQREFLLNSGGQTWVIEPDYMLLYLESADSSLLVDSQYTLLVPGDSDFVLRAVTVHISVSHPLWDSVISIGMDILTYDSDSVSAIGYDRHLLYFDSLGISYDSVTLDVLLQGLYDSEKLEYERGEPKYHSYNTADEHYLSLTDDLATLAASPVCTRTSIGKTAENRDIWAVRISDGNNTNEDGRPEPKILIIGCHHAREWISVEVPFLFAKYLVEKYATDDTAKEIVDNKEIWIVPMLNPDGHEYSRSGVTWNGLGQRKAKEARFWRKNRRDNVNVHNNKNNTKGVDLNRNYAAGREGLDPRPKGGTSDDPASEVYWGPNAFSELETQAIRSLMPFAAVIDYHSYSQLVMYPWGLTKKNSPNECVFAPMADSMVNLIKGVAGGKTYKAQQSSDLYIVSGGFADWAYKRYNIPAFIIELRPGRWDPESFDLPASEIQPTWKENKPALIYFVQWVQNLDYGDAKDPFQITPGKYPSMKANSGAAHDDFLWEWLGECTDGELDSRQVNKDIPYDDGVKITGSFESGTAKKVKVEMRASVLHYRVDNVDVVYDRNRYPTKKVYLRGWFDWNCNGDWADDGGPHISDELNPKDWPKIDDWSGVMKSNEYEVTKPKGLKAGVFWSRFRLSYKDDPAQTTTGTVNFGEVEDYIHSGPDFADAPDPVKGEKGKYPSCKNSNGAWHEIAGIYEWLGDYREIMEGDSCILERRVSIEFDADDSLDEDGVPNLGPPGCCDTICALADLDDFDDGSDIGGRSYEDCIIDTVIVAVSTNGEKAERYAFNDNRDSLLFVNLFIDWTHDGDWLDEAYCHEFNVAVPEHTVFYDCEAIAPKSGFGDGLMNTFPDNKIEINPNKWHNADSTDTLTCRVYKLSFWTPDLLPAGSTWTRWRLDYGEEPNTHLSTGRVDFGEVEDYWIYQGNDTIRIEIGNTYNTIQGQHEYVSITVENNPVAMGGFDFLLAYDASALSFVGAEPGQLPEDCDWEYFSYHHGADANCGDACPSGLLQIIAIAETNNGANHPSCYGPPDIDPLELSRLKFLVTSDRTIECQYVPIRFFWSDCGDNTISSVTGDTLIVSDHVYEYEGTDITDLTTGFPTFSGVQEECLTGGGPDKPAPRQFIDFWNGGVNTICADSIDAPGDINANGLPFEIADAVMFTNYFINGLSAFDVHVDASVAASDVNADGIALSVADLVYLIRVVVGDAQPYPKLAPVEAKADLTNGFLSIDTEIGAAYAQIGGQITPVLLAENMEMKYAYDVENDVTRVLIYSLKKKQTFRGEFLGGIEDKNVKLEMATYDGTPVEARLLPTQFALHQNYPNPFNPVTTLSFDIPTECEYELVILNVLGQTVTSFEGHAEPGVVEVSWDATPYASGVYLYRLTAGSFAATRKMVLLK